jgi:hypothetical protein
MTKMTFIPFQLVMAPRKAAPLAVLSGPATKVLEAAITTLSEISKHENTVPIVLQFPGEIEADDWHPMYPKFYPLIHSAKLVHVYTRNDRKLTGQEFSAIAWSMFGPRWIETISDLTRSSPEAVGQWLAKNQFSGPVQHELWMMMLYHGWPNLTVLQTVRAVANLWNGVEFQTEKRETQRLSEAVDFEQQRLRSECIAAFKASGYEVPPGVLELLN